MKNVSKLFLFLAALTAMAGCAHQNSAAQRAEPASIAGIDSRCHEASGADKVVRNHFKRARRIGVSSCNAVR